MDTRTTTMPALGRFATALLASSFHACDRYACHGHRWRAVALLLVCAPGSVVVAQTFRGSIAGTVTDSSGAVVPNVEIIAVETATASEHKTVSSGAGDYSFADLPLGAYTVTAMGPGFGTIKVDKVPVSAGVVYSLPLTMKVAQAAETVEVSAAGLSLDTTSTTQTTVLPTTTVQNTPMNGRDFTQLISVSPGFSGYSAGGSGSVNGTRANQVNWQIDGSDNNDLWHNIPAVNQGGVEGIAGVTLPLDSIDQFSEQTESNAETGRNPGGTVNVVTKSGTNQIHGSVYYFNRNEFFAANSPFATPDPVSGKIIKNKLRNEQYGASVGGPVFRDRLFYFANYEKQQFIIESPASTTEPSLAYQNQALAVLKQFGVAPNPVQLNVLNTLFPAFATSGPAAPNNYNNASPITGYSYNGVVKVDWQINERNRLSGRGYGGQGSQVAPVGTQIPYYFEEGPIHVYNYSAVLNSTLSARATNQLLVGVNYFNQVFYDQNHSFNLPALGLNTGVAGGLTGTPALTISGFDDLSNATPPSGRNDITGLITDSFAIVAGKHDFRFGGEYRNAQVDEFYQRKQRGQFSYQGSQGPWADPESVKNLGAATNCETATGTTNAGRTPLFTDTPTLALADYLAGCTYSDSIVRGNTKRQVFVNTYSLFAQDAWQLTPTFNLNYGVRYDYLGPLHDSSQDLSVFRPNIANLPVPGIAFQGNQISSLYPAAHDDASPRIGFSWQPSLASRTVVRAGFGVFFDEPNLNPFLDNRPPNNGASGAESNPAGPNPAANIGQNFQVIPTNGAALFPATAAFSPTQSYNLFSVNPNFRSDYDYNFNVNIEQKLGPNLLATFGYVGSEGRKLLVILDSNQAAVGSTGICPAGTPVGGTCTGAQSTFAQNATRPYGAQFPFYGVINTVTSAGTSNYNSFQTTIRSTNLHGLTSQFAYTWAHGLDELSQYRNQSPENSFNLKGNYSNSDYDVRNTFVAYLNYAVPSLGGPHWLGAGWQLNSLLTFRGGTPYTVYTGTDSSGTGENEDRVNMVGSLIAGPRKIVNNGGSLSWFVNNPSSPTFTVPVNAYGNAARNSLYGPGYEDVDFSIFKDGHVTERIAAQFRVEMFNLLNHTNLAPPDSTFSDSSFGTIKTTIGNYNGAPGIGPGEPFNTQLALKIIF